MLSVAVEAITLFFTDINPGRDPAFWTLVKNRCSVGGNLKGGLMKDVSYRWNGNAHAEGLRQIRKLSPRIQFVERDGIEALCDYANDPDAAAFNALLVSIFS